MQRNRPRSPRARRASRRIAAFVLLASLVAPMAGRAEPQASRAGWGATAYDLLLVRPVGVAGALVGTGFFAIAYPMTVLFGDAETTRQVFLEEPFRFAFRRPLGEFQDY